MKAVDTLEMIETLEPSPGTSRAVGLCVGRVVGFAEGTRPLVTLVDAPGAPVVAARSTIQLAADDLGRDVVVWVRGETQAPVVIGKLLGVSDESGDAPRVPVTVEADGDRIVLTAATSISLRCGKASVTLSRDGSVVIEGARVTSRSMGINRVTGAAVHIN